MKRMIILFAAAVVFTVAESAPRFEIDLESGCAFIRYSDIQIPKSTGTRISFTNELQTDPFYFVRGRFTFLAGVRDRLSVLVAPLRFTVTGRIDREVVFEGESFAPNVTLSGVYKFNSYRLSYEHGWNVGDRVHLGLGLTAKIRDAAISIEDSTHASEKTDLGFVPLIKFNVTWRFAGSFSVVLDGDALAAPQGRAEDVSLAIYGDLNDRISLKTGYRVLEGGSDVEAVYSFTWINYVFAGATMGL
jgi:hypothetical protein